ncbi:MAG: DUF2917 domain-containing protein [Pseudomonadota bacterium]
MNRTNDRADSAIAYDLSQHRPLRLCNLAGHRIACLSGLAWITVYGERSDFMLRAGSQFEVPNNGVLLIESISHGARVAISPPVRATPPGSWRHRFQQWRAGIHA